MSRVFTKIVVATALSSLLGVGTATAGIAGQSPDQIQRLSPQAVNTTHADNKFFGSSGYTDTVFELASCIKAVGISGPVRCAQARNHATEASRSAEAHFPSWSLHNGKGDAFRHCYWNARMTVDFGSSIAYKIATNHENSSKGPADEERMDLANNVTGRNVGVSTNSMYTAFNMCKWRADTGRLVTLK